MKTVLLASALLVCAMSFALAQPREHLSEPGSVDELRGLTNVFVTPLGRNASIQKRMTEVIKKRLPHLNFVYSLGDADIWLSLTFEFRNDNYRIPNGSDSSSPLGVNDISYLAHGRIFRVKTNHKLSLIKKFRGWGTDQKMLGSDFAEDFAGTYEKANAGLKPTRTVYVHRRIMSAETPAALPRKQEDSGTADLSQPAKDDIEVLKVDTSLVTVNASVLDRDNRYISNLSKESFTVYEEGLKQQLSFFATVDEPFTVALIIDVSGSVRFKLDAILTAANSFVDQLRPDDKIMVITFASGIREIVKASSSADLKGRGIAVTPLPDPRTLMYDAVVFTLRERLNLLRGRKAIVLLTDGISENGEATYDSSIREAEESGTLVYSIQFETYKDTAGYSRGHPRANQVAYLNKFHYKKGTRYLEELARKSGGRSYQADGVSDFSQAFAAIVKELSSQYSLGYYPRPLPQPGGRRRIKVVVTHPNVAVRARKDYIFTTSGSLPPATPDKEQ
jgi:Ca-activated chloride channel family protein